MQNDECEPAAPPAIPVYAFCIHTSSCRKGMNPFPIALILAIRLYRWTLSPALAFVFGATGRCRFTPSCSEYALAAIQRHGALHGARLALWRIAHCHPWGGCGHDPVPEVGGQRSEGRGQRAALRNPKSEIRNLKSRATLGAGH